jgi:transforming growth factor-beta-induced protein
MTNLTWTRWLTVMGAACAIAMAGCGDDDGTTPDAGGGDGGGDDGSVDQDATTTDDGGGGGDNTIVDVAVEAGNFTTLVSALQDTGLDETLSGAGPFTVFAPTDTAFENLPEDVDLSALTEDELAEILSYHVVAGEVTSDAIPTDPPVADTVADLTLWFDTSDGVMVNDATVTMADVEASNGVIHVIDTVLLPPDVPTMAGYAGLSDLVTAAGDAGVASALAGDGPFTVFAPTNDAFGAVDTGGFTMEELANVLMYHVISGAAVDSASVPTDPPIANTMATNDWENNLTLWFDTSDGVLVNDANVVIADIKVSNGIVHVVDAVITPPNLVDMAGIAGLTELASAAANASDAGGSSIVEILSSGGPFTVLAPTNQAFMDASGTLDGLDNDQLRDALLYHVLDTSAFSEPVLASGVPDADVGTELGQDLTATSDPVTFTDVGGNTANVTIADINVTNGVAHVIDRVLVPSL